MSVTLKTPALLLLLMITVCRAQHREPGSTTSFSYLWQAVMSESWLMSQQLSGRGAYEVSIDVIAWATSPFMKLARNPRSNLTMFLPGPASAYEREAAAQCLSLKDWLNEIAKDPSLLDATFVLVKGNINSTAFSDGLQLAPMLPGDKLVLGREQTPSTDGTGWVLRNASAVRKPGTLYTFEDVKIIYGDIWAGKSVVHVTNLTVRTSVSRSFWAARRAEALIRAGMSPNSTECPSSLTAGDTSPGKLQSKTLGIGMAVAGAGLVALVYTVVLLFKKRGGSGCHSSSQGSADAPMPGKASSTTPPLPQPGAV